MSPLCRLCLMHDETVIRIASECPKLKHCTRIQDMIMWQKLSIEKFVKTADFKKHKNSIHISQRK